MSGGSFGYVYIDMQDPEWAYRAKSKLQDMKEHCEGIYPEAVPHIDDMLQFIHRFDEEYLKKGKKIADLLQSVEWCVSGDSGPDDIQRALDKLASLDKAEAENHETR
jgi:hypothetical protein